MSHLAVGCDELTEHEAARLEYWVFRSPITPPLHYSNIPILTSHSSPGFSINTDAASFCFVSVWRIVRFTTKSKSSGL